ncbi:receptor-type tyrosine-protein phosphatase beta isoform X4 [Xiphophorus maculatus]|uniref:receptor-type tyrosine-protein phosphatase beta isoform X4 n=1 Tax=Xiphophorus maculatus TaxID=8083 RepID=UPI000C6D766D|nr:receptor-type tyrosine-protein phosphatase beta isoform X4 [Xiphophorus maculatus]
MKSLRRFSFTLWTLLVFSALLPNIEAQNSTTITAASTNTETTITAAPTTTTTERTTMTTEPATASKAPVNVSNLNVESITTSSVKVIWNKTDVASYRVYWTKGEITSNETVTQNFKNITGLDPGVQYTISVTAVANDNTTEGHPDMVTVYTKPEVVTNLSVFNVTTSSLLVNWTKPKGSSSFYRIHWKDGRINDQRNVSETSLTISNLTAGEQYTITVTAVAADKLTEGESKTSFNYTKPEAVNNLTVTEVTTTSVSLNWTEPEGKRLFYTVKWEKENKHLITSETQANVTELNPGENYCFNVTAVATDNKTESDERNICGFTKPEIVTNLSVFNVTTSSLFVYWTKPKGSSSFYRIHWKGGEISLQRNVSETYLTISNLTAGEQYTITVTAVAADKRTEGKSETVVKYTKPEAVNNLTVTEVTTTSVSLNWTEPEGKRLFYTVKWENENKHLNTSETQANVTELNPGENYCFNVTAVATDNKTESDERNICGFTKPEVVTNLSVFNVTTSSLFVYWTKPKGNSSFYRVHWKGGRINDQINVSETSLTISNLTAGEQYTITVSAVAADKLTEGKSETVVIYTKPEAVNNLTVTEVTTTSVSVNWTEPEGKRLFYTVKWENGNKHLNTSETQANVTELNPGENYCFNVTAVATDNKTESDERNICQFTKPEVVTNLSVFNVTTSSLFVYWTKPKGSSSFYRIHWKGGEISLQRNVSETYLTISNLTAGEQYTITVSAVAADKLTEGKSETVVIYTKPEAVNNLTVTEVTTTSVSVNWTEPEGKRLFYTVKWENGNKHLNTSETQANVTELNPGENYCFNVTAVTTDNKTESDERNICQFTKPEVVTNLSVFNVTTSSLFVYWTKPKGSSSFYRIHWKSGEISLQRNVSETYLTISNLTAGEQYTITVSAVAADNLTEGKSETVVIYTKPEAVNNLTVTEVTTTSVSLNWTEPEGKRLFYTVKWENENKHLNTSETQANVTELNPGKNYCFNVTAVATDNKTESDERNICGFTKPEVVTNLSVFNVTTSSLFVYWTKPKGNSSFYRVHWKGGRINDQINVSETSLTISNLTAGEQYTITVSAVAADKLTEGKSETVVIYTKPEAVNNLTVTEVTTTSVSLNWTEPEGKRLFYTVKWENGNKHLNTSETQANVTELNPGENYCFNVTAVATDNKTESDERNICQFTKPEVVTNLSVFNVTTSSLFVYWTKPKGSSSFYRIHWKSGEISLQRNVSETYLTISNLTAGEQYTITVSAVAADNLTEGKSETVVIYTKPEAVNNLTVTEVTTTSVSLNWTEPEGKRLFYTVKWENENKHLNTSETQANVTELNPGKNYCFNVTAVATDNKTESDERNICGFTKPEVVTNLSVFNVTTSSLFVYWTKPKGNSSFYRVHWKGGRINDQINVSETSLTISNLTAGEQYTITVTAVAADKLTEGKSETVVIYTKPEAVNNLTVTEVTTTSVSVNWTEPEGKRLFYTVKWENGNKHLNTSETQANVTELTPGENYCFNVTAVATDNKTESDERNICQFTKPEVVTNLSVFNVTTSSLFVYWTKPKGSSSFYRIHWKGGEISLQRNVSETYLTISNLTAGEQYTITVTAVAADKLTEGKSETVVKYTKPEAVNNLTVTEVTTTSVSLNWTEPEGKRLFYTVKWENENKHLNTSETQANVTELNPGENYCFNVTAVATDNKTESDERNICGFTRPVKPVNIRVDSRTSDNINITWTLPEGRVDHYIVNISNPSSNYNVTITNATTAASSGLLPGRSFIFTVTAVAGTFTNTSDQFSFATYPLSVTSFNFTNRTNSSLNLQWVTPKTMDGALNISYIITYNNPNDTVSKNRSTEKTNIELNGLQSGTNYTINITTVGPEQLSSSPVTKYTYTLPNPVQNAKASPISPTSIRVNWSQPLNVQEYYQYRVQTYNSTGVLDNTYINKSSTTSYDVPSLEPGFFYSINITTIVSSDTASNSVAVSSYTMPKAVTDLTVSFVGTTSIQLSWKTQMNFSNSCNYLVEALLGSERVQNSSTNFKNFTFNSLTPGTLYTFNVLTVHEGVSSTSTSKMEYTIPAQVSDILVVGTTSSLSVNWTKAVGQVSSYLIQLYNNTNSLIYNTNLTNETTQHTFENLKPGVLYHVEVVTKSGPKESNRSVVYNATFPNPPGSIMVEFQTNSSIRFNWSLPANMDPPQNFTVFTKNDSYVTKNNSFLLENLESGSMYTVSVVTVGAWGYKSTIQSTQNYTRPNSVTGLTKTKITPSSVTLKWNQANSKPPYIYEVQLTSVLNVSQWKVVNYTTITFDGLKSGSKYNFTVTTVTEDYTRAESVKVFYYTSPYNITDLNAFTLNTTAVYLHWTKPYEYKVDFKYRVETTGCHNQTTNSEAENVTFTDLISGTNCSFCVTVIAENGTEGKEICTTQYTKPNVALLNISNEGFNDSVLVSWTKPPGNVEKYELHLNCSSSPNQTAMPSVNNTFRFYNLHAAELCSAVMKSHSGTFEVPSEIVTTATYPNPPGNIGIQKQSTSSIELQWGQAPHMEHAFNYSYKLTYNYSQNEIPSNKTNYILSQLLSGTSYNISVTTVGPMYFESKSVYKYVTTRPHNVKSLKLDPDEERINLSWILPDEYKDTYHFFVTWQSHDWTYARNDTTDGTLYSIPELTPGTDYNITIITKTSDGTGSAIETVSNCTNASPVKNLIGYGPNSGDAKIILDWDTPNGNYSNFKFTVTNTSTLSYANGPKHTISNLTYHSIYEIKVETQSCGNPSTPQSITCQTGVAKPPAIPSTSVKQVSKTHKTFTLSIETNLINNSKGPVTHVGILVTSDDIASIPDLEKFLVNTYPEWKSKSAIAYLATVMTYTQTIRRSSVTLDFEIGNESKWEGYANGPLDPTGSYKYAVVVCTYLVVDSGKIDTSKSVCSISDLSIVIILDKDPAITYIAIGATLGIFGVLFVILIGFIIYWKRLSRKESPDIQIQSMEGKVSVAVRVEDFEAYYRKQKADSSCGFAEEFEDLKPVGTAQAKLHALALENKPKNRYNNVLPYDSSRVKLSVVHGSPNEDYINANYMPGYLSRKEFIAAQGPLPATVNEFWRMVWEKNVQTVVMLTRCNEQGRVKCEQYWGPGTKYYEDIIVTTTSEIQLEDWTIRDFDIKNVKTTEVRSVRHFHFTAWPDHGVPETTELLISFRHLVREHMNQYSRNSPTVVHCSAGVGRTGTFIAIDRLIFQIERENIVDVYGIVHDLRMHRTLMVQTEDQYVFLNQCALDIIRARTGNNVDLIYQNTAAISIYENVEPKRGY